MNLAKPCLNLRLISRLILILSFLFFPKQGRSETLQEKANRLLEKENQSHSQSESQQNWRQQSFLKTARDGDLEILQGTESLSSRIENSKQDHLVVFMASWCDFCKDEIAKFLSDVRSGTCPRISIVSLDDSEAPMREYLQSKPSLRLPVYWDRHQALKKLLEIKTLPTTFYISKNKNEFKFDSGSKATQDQINQIISDRDGRNGACR